MSAAELMKNIMEFGGDASGIEDRFMGNAELYEICFMEFMEEPHIAALDMAMLAGDYEQAFASAHALKGLSGNLGVTDYYQAVCTLVESLRAKNYAPVNEEYARVKARMQELRALVAGEEQKPSEPPESPPPEAPTPDAPTPDAPTPEAPVPDAPVPDTPVPEVPVPDTPAPEIQGSEAEKPTPSSLARLDKTARRWRWKTKKLARDAFIRKTILLLLAVFLLVGCVFMIIFNNYRHNISRESAAHLIEISHQVKLYIEGKIETDWSIARSVGESIASSNFVNDDASIFALMARQKDIWHATDVMIYTENGYSVCSDGDVTPNDLASDIIVKARNMGEYMKIVDSDIIYTVPVNTTLSYRGARIVAVSLVQKMDSFLDNMGFNSFSGRAWMYLTGDTGIVISRLTHPSSVSAFNIVSLLSGKTLTLLNKDEATFELLTGDTSAAYLTTGAGESLYLVSTHIATQDTPMRLFYLAPVNVVNDTMNDFSLQLVFLSLTVVGVFGALALVLFYSLYKSRKQLFDKALLAREHMFDLLIQNTSTAFGMFAVNQSAPVYSSSNSLRVLGETFDTLNEKDGVYSMHKSTGIETDTARQLNEKMRDWDGKTEFKSGYIQNSSSVEPRYFEIQLFPTSDESTDYVGIAQDVTQVYEREKAVKDALEMAERANAAKSRFLSNMSHDIRTPMNAIVNMTNFAMESIDSPKKLGIYLQTIHESSDHLLRLINDVLDMSRIESGQMEISSESFNLPEELKREADILRPLCEAKHQTLIADFSGVHVSSVHGDQLKLSQVIMNLLSNAVKFTPENGAVRFTAIETPSLREDIAAVRFTVEDNGIGIPKAFMSHVFEPFCRADDRRVSKIEGTGLGLSICHSYVTAMGGTLTCESEEGEGSVFTVDLFFQKAEDTERTPLDAASLGNTPFLGRRCLLAEDNAVNQMIARTMLERVGFMVDTADDGFECMQKFLNSKPGAYDVLYMDIQMPVMDGYQAAVAIRESGHPDARRIPIVAMTANVFAEDIEKARISGMNGHLGKPIMSLNLIEETYRAMNPRKEVAS